MKCKKHPQRLSTEQASWPGNKKFHSLARFSCSPLVVLRTRWSKSGEPPVLELCSFKTIVDLSVFHIQFCQTTTDWEDEMGSSSFLWLVSTNTWLISRVLPDVTVPGFYWASSQSESNKNEMTRWCPNQCPVHYQLNNASPISQHNYIWNLQFKAQLIVPKLHTNFWLCYDISLLIGIVSVYVCV